MHYFAYGSNMDPDQLKERVGDFKIIGVAVLEGYRLKFNKRSKYGSGKANVVPDPQSQIEGVVFNLTETQLKKLDRKEIGYSREAIFLNSGSLSVVTYIANPDTIDENLLPTRQYLETMINGAEKFGLSETYQRKLKTFPTQK